MYARGEAAQHFHTALEKGRYAGFQANVTPRGGGEPPKNLEVELHPRVQKMLDKMHPKEAKPYLDEIERLKAQPSTREIPGMRTLAKWENDRVGIQGLGIMTKPTYRHRLFGVRDGHKITVWHVGPREEGAHTRR